MPTETVAAPRAEAGPADATGPWDLQGSARVTLNRGEYFKTNRCQEWKKVG
ncbi:hypothetical protein NGF19_12195 [Streptomyces sp. RY43-2]|uniref:Uncharacterized protein n=1 Tax=Streptomyces macrolidinus TaxID=2952607 RepID=A0ABT0ZD88_9ACTN|nr:hypothetical protein [Streptomyces macrolidinus]MCN9241541.1 hypothetical protein [Streptomyces macrolidinus]